MKNRKMLLLALLSVVLVLSLILPASGVGASPSVLLQEDFSDGQDQGWSHSGGGIVSIEDDSSIGGVNNKVYNLLGVHDGTQGYPAQTFYDGGVDWTDYEVEFDIKLHESDSMALINFRFSDWNNYYDLAIRTGDGSWGYGGRFQFSQHVGGVWNSWWIGAPVEVGTWYHIKVSAIGDRIRLYFNGELKFDQTGFTLPKGKIGFWTTPWPGNPADWPIWSGGHLASYGHVHIDNIVVTGTAPPLLLSVPYYAQLDTNWCGPTSLAMVLNYYGERVHNFDIADALNLKNNKGTNFDDLFRRGLEDYVTDTYGKSRFSIYTPYIDSDESGLETIRTYLDQGCPVILAVVDRFPYPFRSVGKHAVVVTGYFSTGLYINDPSGALLGWMSITGATNIGVPVEWEDLAPYIHNSYWTPFIGGNIMVLQDSVDPSQLGTLWVGSGFVEIIQRSSDGGLPTGAGWELFLNDGLDWNSRNNPKGKPDSADDLFAMVDISNHALGSREYFLEAYVQDNTGTTVGVLEPTDPTPEVNGQSMLSAVTFDISTMSWIEKAQSYTLIIRLWNDATHEPTENPYDEIRVPLTPI